MNISALIITRKLFMENYMFNLFHNFDFDLLDESDLRLLDENRSLINIITALGATVFLVEAYIIYTKLIIACLRYTFRKRRRANANSSLSAESSYFKSKFFPLS